jgi:DNA helicase-2/ATP-dependent DNA helicase PcrA
VSEPAPDILQGLNEPQRRAVEYSGGPLMVLAGPGTGKTRVITHRLARLVTVDHVPPERVLALTYTVKAAESMRNRLRELVGAAAESIGAMTFHGLGYRLVKRFADRLGFPPPSMWGASNVRGGTPDTSGLIDSAQHKRLLRSVIFEHGLFKDRRAEGLEAVVDLVMQDAGTLADACIFPDQAQAFVERERQRLASEPLSTSSSNDRLAREGALARLARLEQSARAIELFGTECRRRGWLTFADLISLPIQLLRTSSTAASILRSQYRHIVVDEFQDVNTAQIELLRLLAPPESNPDLCVVGDDDQSIYEFRGADDRAFHRFAQIWKAPPTSARTDEPPERIVLADNYRSHASIIKLSNCVIARALNRFAPDKVINPASTASFTGALTQALHLEDDSHAGDAIAHWILADRSRNPQRQWGSYAVIARSNIDLDRIRAALEMEGVPCVSSRRTGFAEDEGVRDALAWVQAIVEPRSTYPIVRLLTRPPHSLDLRPVSTWERQYRAQLSRLNVANDDGSSAGASRNASRTASDPGAFITYLASSLPNEPAIAHVASEWSRLSAASVELPACELISRIITSADLAHAELLSETDRSQRVQALVALLQFCRQRQGRLEAPGDLRAFWSYWQDLSDPSRELGSADNPENRVDRTDPSEAAAEELNAVHLLTAHASKGLEFDTVFVPRVTPSHGYGKSRKDEPSELPEELFADSSGASDPLVKQQAEERRIFYVACTRAERRLILLSKKNKSPSKSIHYLEQLCAEPGLKDTLQTTSAKAILDDAAKLGIGALSRLGAASRTPLDDITNSISGLDRWRETFLLARRDIRAQAAASLDHVQRSNVSAADIQGAAEAATEAARKLGALAAAQAAGSVPEWAAGTPIGVYVQGVIDRAREEKPAPLAPSSQLIIPKAPLELSYSAISTYDRCPGCYYVQHVLGLRPSAGRAQLVGIIVHAALEKFFQRIQYRESEGLPAPTLNDLLNIARDAFFTMWPAEKEMDKAQLDQSLAQLRGAYSSLITEQSSTSNILELEREFEFPYGSHRFVVRLDRVDQYTDDEGRPAFRIIDYKTGLASGKLLEPKDDDLQLGMYAMALEHLYPDPDAPPSDTRTRLNGVAEYWVLSQGRRGVIDLASLRMDKVRKTIDKSITGMLAGQFVPKKDCSGDCRLFGR